MIALDTRDVGEPLMVTTALASAASFHTYCLAGTLFVRNQGRHHCLIQPNKQTRLTPLPGCPITALLHSERGNQDS